LGRSAELTDPTALAAVLDFFYKGAWKQPSPLGATILELPEGRAVELFGCREWQVDRRLSLVS
jgi:hypothetical protein